MDFAVSYQTGGGGSFTGTGMNMLRLLVALLTFSRIPILLFQTSMDIYGTVRSVVVGSMDLSLIHIYQQHKSAPSGKRIVNFRGKEPHGIKRIF